MSQFARPILDISLGGWSGPAWSKINEAVPDDDASYTEKTGSGTLEIGLSGVNDPGVRTGHIIKIRVKQQSGAGAKEKLLCELYDGSTKITEISSGNLTRGTYITVEYTIPEEEANLITEYNLILKFTPTQGSSEVMRLTWAEVKVPDAGGEEHSGSGSISGNGSPTGTVKKGGIGSALKSAGGLLLAVGLAGMLGIASIVGGGSQVAIGEKDVSASASVSGRGSVTASGVASEAEGHSGVAVVSGDGALIALGTKSAEGSGEVSDGGIIGARAGGGASSTVWLTGWKHRKKITVQDAFVDGDLANFPTYVPIKADADFHEARADGHDIRFTLSDGKTLLKYEREHWIGGNGSPATAHFWVKIPSILADGGALIYVYYGKSDAPDGEDAPNVWDANFKGVWHLKDLTLSTVADSTGVNNGTKLGPNEPIEADGKIYKGQEHDGENDFIDCGNDESLNIIDAITISFFAKNLYWYPGYTPFPSRYANPIWKGVHSPSAGWGVMTQDADNGYGFYAWIGGIWRWCHGPSLDDTSAWNHIAVTYDNLGDKKVRLYYNAVLKRTYGPYDGGLIDTLAVPFRTGFPYKNYFYGLVDEVRISNIVRAPTWRKFEHYNINEADNEITWGIEESLFPIIFDVMPRKRILNVEARTRIHDISPRKRILELESRTRIHNVRPRGRIFDRRST